MKAAGLDAATGKVLWDVSIGERSGVAARAGAAPDAKALAVR